MPNIINKTDILKVLDRISHAELMATMERSFTSYTSGEATVPPVGSLEFEKPPGGVHIKYGYLTTSPYYVIKIASGFYDNPKIGLPGSNGLNLVFRQETGELEAILLDEGYLTDLRTALAGAVVAKHFAPPQVDRIGIVGTGLQARMQLEQIAQVTNCREVIVWGRSAEKVETYRHDMETKGFNVSTTLNAADLTATCNLIITATPSKKPILPAGLRPGTLVIAMGADTPGKQELDVTILENADLIVLDSNSQCSHHGEIHKAWADGLLHEDQLIEIGGVLMAKERFNRIPNNIIVADLTGIATQDMLISELVLSELNK
ncbi:MAG: ornithine cyclodeaminase [Neolewinella sp.]|jgi:ornithine cyclodeaminase|nr:ornithine cyclodeaminase family protein [Lewinella sp.]